MKRHHAAGIYSGIGVMTMLLVSLVLIGNVSRAYGEMYIGGQGGVALPSIGGGLTNAEFNITSPNVEIPDLPLKTSILYGGKVGYYFPKVSWFGLETEVFNTTPHMKQLDTTITFPAGTFIPTLGTTPVSITTPATFVGNYMRVLMWAPANLMFRYPNGRLQPYIGFGPGIFFSRVSATAQGVEASQSNIRVGVNAKAGVEFFLTRHIALFGEWKYNWVQFNFDDALGIEATYSMHLAAGGLSYHF